MRDSQFGVRFGMRLSVLSSIPPIDNRGTKTLKTVNSEMKVLLKCETIGGPSCSPAPSLTASKRKFNITRGDGDDETPLKKKKGNEH